MVKALETHEAPERMLRRGATQKTRDAILAYLGQSPVGGFAQRHPPRRNDAGFTIIELLIVIMVSVVITTFLIATNSSTREQVTLHIEIAKLAQVVLRAKAAALAATDPLTLASSSLPTFVPVCGYGVHVDRAAGNYFLFRYGDPSSNTVTCKEQLAEIDPMDPTYAVIGSTYTLPPGVAFLGGDPEEMTDVFYVPPYPTTFIGAASFGPMTSSTDAVGSVVLVQNTSSSSPLTVRITVTGTGQVNY